MTRWLQKLAQTRLTDQQREAQVRRILLVETNVMLPIKFVAFVAASYFYQNELRAVAESSAEQADAAQAYIAQLNFYGFGNVIFWVLLLAARLGRMWPRILRFSAFWLAMLDHLFLSGLIYFTGGLESVLFWLYIGLMVRSAVNFPVFWQQMVLNFGTAVFYTLAVILSEETWHFFQEELYWLRLMVLVLLGSCCWGVYMLLQRERVRSRNRHEFQLREQSAAASGRLAAEMAHQLKNPLGIINNAAYVLQRQIANRQPVEGESVDVIREEVSRCDKILTQLMDYARLSEGRIENVDVNRVLEQALTQALAAAGSSPVQVEKLLTAGLPTIPVQRAQLEESFLNLIQNSLEAMPQGGTLTLQTRLTRAGQIQIQITDTGHGMEPAVQARIFEAFYTTKPGGTGLGLAIVKQLVENCGGTIDVTSQVNAGAQFTLSLPVHLSKIAED
jgi:signal transduction histidine kinase